MIEALTTAGGMLAGGVGMSRNLAMASTLNPMLKYGMVAGAAVAGGSTVTGVAAETWNEATDPYASGPRRFFGGAWQGAKSGAMLGAGFALFPVMQKLARPGGIEAVQSAYHTGVGHMADLRKRYGTAAGRHAADEFWGAGSRMTSNMNLAFGAERGVGEKMMGVRNVLRGHFGEEMATMGRRAKMGGLVGAGVGLGMALLGSFAQSSSGPSIQSNRPIY